jgi:3-oxoacyl-[acyl-carrier-protein] synthase II
MGRVTVPAASHPRAGTSNCARMSRRRVVVTGLGLISPVGNTVAEAWANLLAGRSASTNITKFDASAFSCRFAGEVKGFNVEDYIPAKEARHMDTFIHYGMAAACRRCRTPACPRATALTEEAGRAHRLHGGLGHRRAAADRADHQEYRAARRARISPFFVPASIINMISGPCVDPPTASPAPTWPS